MLYLLHEHPMVLLAPTNHLRITCEKSQLNNSFESIIDEDVPYSIVVENITAEETKDMFKPFAMLVMCFFICFYIFSLEYPKNLKQNFY